MNIFLTQNEIWLITKKKANCEKFTIFKYADDKSKTQLKDTQVKHVKAKEIARQIKEREKQIFSENVLMLFCFNLELYFIL